MVLEMEIIVTFAMINQQKKSYFHADKNISFYTHHVGYADGFWPLHPDFLRSDEAARLHDLFRMNYETMHLFRMSRKDRNRVTELALRYYRLHVPDMPELKCLDVLKTLFD